MTTPGPAATPPVVTAPRRNRLGIAALALALFAILLPFVVLVVVAIAASIEGAEGDSLGYAFVGGLFFAGLSTPFIAPLAILALVLGIAAVARRGYRKVQAVLAIILSIGPALLIIGLPGAIDTLF